MSLILFFFIYSPVLFNLVFFFFNDTATTEIYTLSLHDALPICIVGLRKGQIEEAVWFLAETVVVAVLRDADYGERSEEHTSELQSQSNLVCRLLLEKKKTSAMSNVETPL